MTTIIKTQGPSECPQGPLCPTTTTTTTTTEPSGGGQISSEVVDQDEVGVIGSAIDTAGDALDTAGDVAGDIVDTATGLPGDVAGFAADQVTDLVLGPLNDAAVALAGNAFGKLALEALSIADPDTVVIAGLLLPIHTVAGAMAFAAIATTLFAAIVTPRRKLSQRIGWAAGAFTRYILVALFGVVVALAAVEVSRTLTIEALVVTLPEEVNATEANLWNVGAAVLIVPLVGVAFDFQSFFMAVLIVVWPFAAAASITRSFRHALPIVTGLVVANCFWPPLAGLCIGKAFAALPDVSTATWWCLAAVLTAPICNMFALAARSNT